MSFRRLATCCCLLALSGCAGYYHHTPAVGEPTATVRLTKKLYTALLTDHEGCPRTVWDQTKKTTSIPAGKRLWAAIGYSLQPYGGECMVSMSFVAQAGKEYVVDYYTEAGGCRANVFEQDRDGGLHQSESVIQEKFSLCMY